MTGFTRFNAALLASTLLVAGFCSTANAQIAAPAVNKTSATFSATGDYTPVALKNISSDRQYLLNIYNQDGAKALLTELKKNSPMQSVNIERKRLLEFYTNKGQAALITDLRGPIVAKKTIVKTVVSAKSSIAAMTVAQDRQTLLKIYDTQGTKALITELKKKTTSKTVNAERKRLLDLYTKKGRAAMVADLRTAAVKPAPVPSPKMTPAPAATPYVAPTAEPTPYVEPTVEPTPKPAPKATPKATPVPMVTSAPVVVAPAPVVTVVASPEPMVSLKLGYWAANNELAKNVFDNNTGMITGNLELMPMGSGGAFGFSGAAMTYPTNYSSAMWDAYLRVGAIKVGYRNEELLRRNIPINPTANKADVRSESAFGGLAFGMPLLGDMLGLDFDLLGGTTFRNIPIGAEHRVFTDLSAMFVLRPVSNMDLNVGYRSFVFGSYTDIKNVYTMTEGRSAFFGSYQGPTAGLAIRF